MQQKPQIQTKTTVNHPMSRWRMPRESRPIYGQKTDYTFPNVPMFSQLQIQLLTDWHDPAFSLNNVPVLLPCVL